MQENHQATKYFIKFTQLSSRVYWGEAALLQQAYNGLAKWIKNEMVHHEKPMTLSGLRKLMQAIDTRYWECKPEIARETPTANSSGNKSEKNDNNKSSSDKGKGSSQSKQKTAYEMILGDWSSDVCSSDLYRNPAMSALSALRPVPVPLGCCRCVQT